MLHVVVQNARLHNCICLCICIYFAIVNILATAQLFVMYTCVVYVIVV